MAMPVGNPLPMASVSPDWKERFPLGAQASNPDCREGTSILLPRLEPALVCGDVGRLRVPAIHLATGAPAFLVAPATVPNPGLLFRDLPEFAPAPALRDTDLEDWPNAELLKVKIACTWHT